MYGSQTEGAEEGGGAPAKKGGAGDACWRMEGVGMSREGARHSW